MKLTNNNVKLILFITGMLIIVIILFSYVIKEKFLPYEVIIENAFRRPVHMIIPNQMEKGKKVIYFATGDKPLPNFMSSKFYMLIDAEPHNNNHSNYDIFDLIITTKKSQVTNPQRHIYTPGWSIILGESPKWSIPDLLRKRKLQPKNKFCAYMYSNCDTNMDGVNLREIFFEKLNSKKGVDALGRCKHNTDIPSHENAYWIDVAIDTYKNYKFVIAFENMLNVKGYVSEKIVLPLLAGAIPIYYGDESVKDMFEPGCFINLADFSSVESCIDYVLYVDSNPKLYERYIQSPIIRKEKLVQYAGWYYGTKSFYDVVFNAFPHIKRQPYVPIQDRTYKSNPEKIIKVVNLDQSRDRWNMIQKHLDTYPDYKNKYERFPAVEGKKYYNEYKKYRSNKHHDPSPGEMGIYFSAMEVCNALVQDDQNDYYLLLEDDVVLNKDILPIESYISQVPEDWDMIFIGANKTYCKPTPKKQGDKYVKMGKGCMPGNFAPLFRKRAAQYLLNFAFPMEYPIDEYYRVHCENLNIYLIYPTIITVNYDLPSTIR